jgi:uncharacterized membrane protein YhaH (DUF805 family)
MFILIYWLISLPIAFLAASLNAPSLPLLYLVAHLIPIWSASSRRLHDVGYSGWLQLVPIFNPVVLCFQGNPEGNKYGASVGVKNVNG